MTTQTAKWVAPPAWTVPREWVGERCFVLCSGESIGKQSDVIKKLKGRFIAVKHGVLTRPDADVLFLSGEGTVDVAKALIPRFKGKYIVVRGRHHPQLPENVLKICRHKDHLHLSDRQDHVGGYDSGTSAIHLAWLFGATEIVILGMDMRGGHFCDHPLQYPPPDHFSRHMSPLQALAEDAKAKGIRIVNCSPTSAIKAFERQPLEAFL